MVHNLLSRSGACVLRRKGTVQSQLSSPCCIYKAASVKHNGHMQETYTLKVPGQRFTVPEGSLGAIASASPGLLLRGGTGAFVAGYTASLVDKDDTKYTVTEVGGRNIKEESKVCTSTKLPDV
jgi:hypothetical protein